MKNIQDKVIVITGASSGIGRATALEIARQGGTVVLVSRRKTVLEELAHECESYGGKAMAAPADVCREKELAEVVKKAIDKYGKIDVWVNNAAITLLGPFEKTPLKDSKQVIETNVMGYMNSAHAVMPIFKKQGFGNLINVSSMVALTGQPFSAAYTVSKFAIRGLSFSLEQEYSDVKDIHVCSVLPSVIDTPLFQSAANYMGKEIKAPEPVISAQKVAESIIDLVLHPQKEVVVGYQGKVAKLLKNASSPKFDHQIRKKILKDHFKKSSTGKSTGNLYTTNGRATISGGWLPENNSKKDDGVTLGWGLVVAGLVASAYMMVKSSMESKPKTLTEKITRQVKLNTPAFLKKVAW
ncbi:SDR family NAD(P)-dependent oxidoreductase [Litoribacter alkaliphilus]|uniref:SDR family NAD(P)-dependent oxidoreductase n=1 Tax=Litoribacter ruber TaxID=702568 RepID=A0AAP2CHL6_9BACT|nr:SDR family NAD(P)-dependent oxidoreductase [Litoribacter alkaliphilus]MBS9524868.1 SDR family NAD(P)-dependent oxidoreductase [Litoribacter alkaliphilus]